MDADNLERVTAVARENGANGNRIALLRDFDPESAPGDEVPDPYFGGERGFEEVHDMVERACRGLLAHLRERHAL
jgi:protein-tyrosine phosphatase